MNPVDETIKTYNSFAQEYRDRYKTDGDDNKMKPSLDKFISAITTGKKFLILAVALDSMPNIFTTTVLKLTVLIWPTVF